jgi:hypothetical protein
MVGVARDVAPETGSGSSLYAVIGQAPRRLDHNLAIAGRVLQGMPLLSALPRGAEPMGFYTKPAQRVAITSVRLAADVPASERVPIEVLRTDSPTFAALIDAKRHGHSAFYPTPVGKLFKSGVDLSGGEWQKIAIARAYMRDAPLLILDEPTAALDARSEFEVFQRFKELSQGKTAVIISHRFSTVRMADRIIVLDGGRIEEIGSHADLLAANGHYAELFELQAAGYR